MYRKNIFTNRNVSVFERDNDEIEFGAPVRKECAAYKEQIPSETLVLSFFNKLKLKTDIFTSVFSGIMNILIANTDSFEDLNVIEKILPGIIDNAKQGLLNFLNAIDTGIKDIHYARNDKDIYFWTVHYDGSGNQYQIDLFYDESSKAQLIYTTHDTTLLDKKFFRRDQIWFVQKDEAGRSQLSALSDFKVRSDASFEKDYLAGVYGGIPLIKDFEMREGE